MCYVLFLAADQPLPLIAWYEGAPDFNVTDLRPHEQVVRTQFTKPYVYCLGSHTQCGCGFRWSAGEPPSPDADPATADSMHSLSEYLGALTRTGSVELYACWNGDESDPPETRSTLTASQFAEPGFSLRERQFLTVVAVD